MDSCPECGKETILNVRRGYGGEDAMITVVHEREVAEHNGFQLPTITDSCFITDGYEA
jgi:hypothetical protein